MVCCGTLPATTLILKSVHSLFYLWGKCGRRRCVKWPAPVSVLEPTRAEANLYALLLFLRCPSLPVYNNYINNSSDEGDSTKSGTPCNMFPEVPGEVLINMHV